MTELTMIPAQCGVSRAMSEGLMANIRKATTVTAAPNSSWSRATSRGKRQTRHLRLSSGAGLSSLFFFFSSLSEEPFCPCPISPLCSRSVRSTFTVAVFGVDKPACRLSLSTSLPLPAKASSHHKHSSSAIWKQRRL